MLYAGPCCDSEAVAGSWTREQDAVALARLDVGQEKLAREGRLGPVARIAEELERLGFVNHAGGLPRHELQARPRGDLLRCRRMRRSGTRRQNCAHLSLHVARRTPGTD